MKSIAAKVLAILLAGITAIALSFAVSHFTFNKTLQTISEIVAPNPKLVLLNGMFRNLTQLQNASYSNTQNPSNENNYSKESGSFQSMLDTLSQLYQGDNIAAQQIDSIKTVLLKRNQLLQKYSSIQRRLRSNQNQSREIQSLSSLIDSGLVNKNPIIVSSVKKTTTSYTNTADTETKQNQRRLFFQKLFGKRKKTKKQTNTTRATQEELTVQSDTIIDSQRDRVLREIEAAANNVGRYQRYYGEIVVSLQTQIGWLDTALVAQFTNLIKSAEVEELQRLKTNENLARTLAQEGSFRLNIVMLVFFLVIVALIIMVFADIFRSNEYKKQLMAAKEEAERLSEVKQRFLANMSHEIRTPLQSIIGFAEQAGQNPRPEYINAIYNASEHLMHIVNEVLDYSRIVSGKFTFTQSNFNMPHLVNEVTGALQIEAEAKGLQLLTESDITENQILNGDEFRLRQILYNLLGNAIKFTDTGYVKLAISGMKENNNYNIMFAITDTGIGIASKDRERIFNEFEQADITVSRVRGGTGLGLAIVKELVKNQGGQIKVDSAPGKGSTFTVNLIFGFRQEMPANAVSLVSPESFKDTVLVVDDDNTILMLCSSILQKHHIAYICFNDPLKVLSEKWNDSVRWAFIDIRMPGMNGIEVCKVLREKLQYRVKIYALTAQTLPDEREAILQRGFDGLLMKPFRETEFLHFLGIAPVVKKTNAKLIKEFPLLSKMTFDDPVAIKNILLQFTIDMRADLRLLDNYLQNNNTQQASDVLHKIAGRVGQIGAADLCEMLQKMEINFRNNVDYPVSQFDVKEVVTKLNDLVHHIGFRLTESN